MGECEISVAEAWHIFAVFFFFILAVFSPDARLGEAPKARNPLTEAS